MVLFVTITFLFCVGAITGWCIEVVFRKFFSSSNPEHKWINPGFCLGPWLPLYGFGVVGLYAIATYINIKVFEDTIMNRLLLFVVMALAMTLVEFIAGEYCERILKVKLWDYTDCWGNIDGVICPLFTFFWGILGVIYYYALHPYMETLVGWLMQNQLYTFFIGVFYGVFMIDVIYSGNFIAKVKKFAKENEVVIEIEKFKMEFASVREQYQEKKHYFLSYHSSLPLQQHLNNYINTSKMELEKLKEKIEKLEKR